MMAHGYIRASTKVAAAAAAMERARDATASVALALGKARHE
jgi:hypothetical protein